MRKLRFVFFLAGLFLTIGSVSASDIINTYTCNLDPLASSVNLSVWVNWDGGESAHGSTGPVSLSGSISQKLWQEGANYDVFMQTQVTDVTNLSIADQNTGVSWPYADYTGTWTLYLSVSNFLLNDLDDYDNPLLTPPSYTHPVGTVDNSTGNFNLEAFGITTLGSMDGEVDNNDYEPVGYCTEDLATWKPHFSTWSGNVTKTDETMKFTGDFVFGGTKDLAGYNESLSGYTMFYQFTTHMESEAVPFQAPEPITILLMAFGLVGAVKRKQI